MMFGCINSIILANRLIITAQTGRVNGYHGSLLDLTTVDIIFSTPVLSVNLLFGNP